MVKNQGRLEAARIQRLEEIGFVWSQLGESWDEMIGRLAAYKQQYGDCLVPPSYSDKQLVNWVIAQRRFKNRGKLKTARVQQLKELEFVWDPIGNYWEEMFSKLVAYKQQHGDCLVARRYSDRQLASWVQTQRVVRTIRNSKPNAFNGWRIWSCLGPNR